MKLTLSPISLVILTILFIQCNKNEVHENNENKLGNETISIDDVMQFMPGHLLKESTLLYVNSDGNKMELKSVSTKSVRKHKNGEIEYSTETISTRLYSEINHIFNITLTGSGHGQRDGTYTKSLLLTLMPMIPTGNLFFSITLNNGEPINDLFTPDEIESIELLGRSFERVFKGMKNDSDTYSELFYSPVNGVIAFRDENNDLWVLDEVIE